MGMWANIVGTLKSSFGIGPRNGRATLDVTGLTANRTLTLPNRSGTVALNPDPVTTLTDGATITLDASTGNRFVVTLGGNRTLALSNIADGQKVEVFVYQDGTGGRTLAYSGVTIRWQGGSAPVLTAVANKLSVIAFERVGSNYLGYFALNF